MAIICHKREPSQEPRPTNGIRVKMKVTVERKIHETEDRGQKKLRSRTLPKRKLFFPSLLNLTPTPSPLDPWPRRDAKRQVRSGGQNLIKNLGFQNPNSAIV